MVQDPADALYTVAPGDFVAARDRLAAELRKGGDAKRAAAVKAMRKPSLSAWAVNQAVRRAPEALRAFLAANEALFRAQTGGDASGDARQAFRAAVAEQRDALDRLARAAAQAMEEAGLPARQAVLERVANDLRRAAVAPELRPLLEAGRLETDVAPQGFGAILGDATSFAAEAAAPRREAPRRAPPATTSPERRPRPTDARQAPGRGRGVDPQKEREERRARAAEERRRAQEEARAAAEEARRAREAAAAHRRALADARAAVEDAQRTSARAARERDAVVERLEALRAEIALLERKAAEAIRAFTAAEAERLRCERELGRVVASAPAANET